MTYILTIIDDSIHIIQIENDEFYRLIHSQERGNLQKNINGMQLLAILHNLYGHLQQKSGVDT